MSFKPIYFDMQETDDMIEVHIQMIALYAKVIYDSYKEKNYDSVLSDLIVLNCNTKLLYDIMESLTYKDSNIINDENNKVADIEYILKSHKESLIDIEKKLSLESDISWTQIENLINEKNFYKKQIEKYTKILEYLKEERNDKNN